MRRRSILLLFALLLCLGACSKPKPIDIPELTDILPADTVAEYDPGGGDKLRVIYAYEFGGPEGVEQINKILSEEGFNLVLETFEPTSRDIQSSYTGYIRQNLSENAVFLTMPGWNIEFTLRDEGALGNFYDACMAYTPEYLEYPTVSSFNDPAELRIMPTNFRSAPTRSLAVMVREDVAAEYGREINTGSDWVELLDWLKAKDPDSIPGIAVSEVSGNMFYPPLDLFLPENGYGNYGNIHTTVMNIATSQVFPTYSLPETKAAIEEFKRLQRDGYLYLKSSAPQDDRAFNEFPTALLYSYDFIDAVAWTPGLSDFDASGYRMYTLYKGQLPNLRNESGDEYYSPTCAVAGQNADVSELLRLIQWLSVKENYRRLFYGKEGVDYTVRDGRIQPIDTGIDWETVRGNLYYFERSEFAEIPITAPSNLESELSSFSYAYEVILTENAVAEFSAWWEGRSEVDSNAFYQIYLELQQINNRIFISNPTLNESSTAIYLDSFISKQNIRLPLLQSFADVVNNAIAESKGEYGAIAVMM